MLNIRQLPPPFWGTRNLRNINGVSRPAVSPETILNFVMTLLHTVYTRIGRAFCCLTFLIFLASCSNDDEVHFVKISEYYAESCHLDQATQDSIVRFAQKVDAFIAANPQAKEDPLYPRILHNIQTSSFDAGLALHTDCNDTDEINF